MPERPERDLWGDECVAAVGGADGLGEQGRACALEDEADGTGSQRTVDVVAEAEGGAGGARGTVVGDLDGGSRGVGSSTGSRSITLIAVIGWQSIATGILYLASVLGCARDLVLLISLCRSFPVRPPASDLERSGSTSTHARRTIDRAIPSARGIRAGTGQLPSARVSARGAGARTTSQP